MCSRRNQDHHGNCHVVACIGRSRGPAAPPPTDLVALGSVVEDPSPPFTHLVDPPRPPAYPPPDTGGIDITRPEQPEAPDLLTRFRRGDDDACLQVEQWAAEVVRSPRYGVPPAERPDLVQESLRQTWEQSSQDGFTLTHSLRALVHRVAMARCVDWLRRKRTLVEMHDDLLHEFPEPTARLEQEQLLGRLQQGLQALKPFCRDLIRWHFHEQQTYPRIAQETGRNESTLRVHMFNCIKVLRSYMGTCDD